MARNIIMVILAIVTCVSAHARIQCSKQELTMTVPESSSEWLFINDFNGLIWRYANNHSYFKIDLSNSTRTSISASYNCINFYDYDRGYYQNLFVQDTHVMSDSCLKYDVKPLEFDVMQTVRPVTFKWTENSHKRIEKSNLSDADSDKHCGFIAQELAEVIPEVVKEDDYGNLMVNYASLIPILIKSLQDIDKQCQEQSAELDRLLMELSIYGDFNDDSSTHINISLP